MMKVRLQKKSDGAIVPMKQSEGAACYDLYCSEDFFVKEKSRCIAPTDISIELPFGYVATVKPRSGFSSKGMEGVKDIQTRENVKRFDADVKIGTIDSDYRGSIGVIIRNNSESFYILKGTRIAQLEISKCEDVEFEVVETLSESKRGSNGFGSTGTK